MLVGAASRDETDVRWSINPTAAEKLCEHANVSLTERLRRDFGIDAAGSDEEDKGSFDIISKYLSHLCYFCGKILRNHIGSSLF